MARRYLTDERLTQLIDLRTVAAIDEEAAQAAAGWTVRARMTVLLDALTVIADLEDTLAARRELAQEHAA